MDSGVALRSGCCRRSGLTGREASEGSGMYGKGSVTVGTTSVVVRRLVVRIWAVGCWCFVWIPNFWRFRRVSSVREYIGEAYAICVVVHVLGI